jgi:hypothetical protein
MNAKKKINNKIGFHLNKITTEQFAIIQDAFDDSFAEINMSINLKFGLDRENKVIASFVLVQFEQKDKPFLLMEIANHYKIIESAWIEMQNSNNKLVLAKEFASHLVMLTIGTLRGALHCKTENTEFNKYILPTINVTELIKSDVELS